MKQVKRMVLLAAWVLTLSGLTILPAAALEVTLEPEAAFCFSAEDFSPLDSDDGIFLTAVPAGSVASLRYGDRVLRAGDALTREALNQLTLTADCVTRQDTAVQYCTVSDGQVTGRKEIRLSILPRKNEAPTAKDMEFETYKNMANTGTLQGEDPEGAALTYTLVTAPKRGTVELAEDGSFTYTPDKNKVGKDRFTYTVTDEDGAVSEEAQVTIRIKKPTDKATYADMAQDSDAFAAMWLKEEGLFSGSSIGGTLCFAPEQTVSRGEFLVMVMKLADEEGILGSTGFADEADTPQWLRPYLVSALRSGMISGAASADGVVFRPDAAMTKAEAVVMVQNLLQLPVSDAQAVFAEDRADTVPVWAAEAAAALSQAGIRLDMEGEADTITRLEAAKLLYRVDQLLDEQTLWRE